MNNIYTEYLLNNGWIQSNQMRYNLQRNPSFELFFDTSNQIELYIKNERKNEKYLQSLDDLIIFLKDNNLIS